MAHTTDLKAITQAKIKTDKNDALKRANLLRMSYIPKAYVCPKEIRSIRDLNRNRMKAINLRSHQFINLKVIVHKYGARAWNQNKIAKTNVSEVIQEFDDPMVRLDAKMLVERINLLTTEKTIS